MLPRLTQHAFYQLTKGNISLWSMPWCPLWRSIHDFLIPQTTGFVYPSLVSDLWLPGQKVWNHELIFNLFDQTFASQVIAIDIIHDDIDDLLCWPLATNGICSPKSAYKLCLQEIHNNPITAPMQVSSEVKNLLTIIWHDKNLLPKVQTFAWRLLRRALPTGMRAGHFSVHISQICSRCGMQEDDLHLFFLCDFARAAWFSKPWFIRSHAIVQGLNSVHLVIARLLSFNHPHASLKNILNFLWCMWKTRNDFLFERKKHQPYQVHILAAALDHYLQNDSLLHSNNPKNLNSQHVLHHLPPQGSTIKSVMLLKGPKIYTNAAFKTKKAPGIYNGQPRTGIGVYFCLPLSQGEINIQVQASALPTTTLSRQK